MGIFDELNHFTNNTAFDQAQTDASTTNLPTYDSPFGENSVFSDSFNSTRELRKTHISLRDYTQKKKLSIAHEHLFRLNADQAYIQEAKNEYNNDILCGTFPTQITTYAYNITNHLKKQLETYSNNFTWFFEDNPKALNFFVYKIPFTNKVLNIVADIGSDFFDCIKLKKISNEQAITALIAAFKKNASYLEDELSYDEELIKNAITKEFNAEKAYQEIVKNLTDIFSESEAVQKILALSNGWTEELKGYKIEKKHYLPEEEDFQPLFFPVFKNDIKTDQTPIALKEFFQDYKEAYWFAMNAILCGQINAVIDEGKNVTELPKFLYEILTNRGSLKIFIRSIQDILNNTNDYILKALKELNRVHFSGKSVYQFWYQIGYDIGFIGIALATAALGKIVASQKTVAYFKFLKQIANHKLFELAYRAGCAIEVDGEQLILKYYGTTIAKGTPEKLSKKLEKLLDLKKINPNVRYAFIGTRKLNDLIALRKTHKSLFNANIATMWVKIVEVGKPPRILEFKAQSGKRNQIGGSHKAKERYKNEIDNHLDNEGKPSWNDSENKMIRDLQDNHLNFKEGLNIENIKIEIELYSIYHPCSRCQEVISQFQKYYNAKIKVYSTELRGNTDFIKKYPNLSTKNN